MRLIIKNHQLQHVDAVTMPLPVLRMLETTIGLAWDDFIEEMHDGPVTGPDVPEKFWNFLVRTG